MKIITVSLNCTTTAPLKNSIWLFYEIFTLYKIYTLYCLLKCKMNVHIKIVSSERQRQSWVHEIAQVSKRLQGNSNSMLAQHWLEGCGRKWRGGGLVIKIGGR